MKKYFPSIFCLLFYAINICANPIELKKTDANIIGHVIDKKTGEHLPYITISLRGTTIGTTTDATGHYFLTNLPEGRFTMEVKFIGYETAEKEVELKKGATLEVNFELEESNVTLDEVVVSSNRNETSRRLAPTLVSILDTKTFERTSSMTVADGLNFQPGLRVENNCQNCGFTQVRMNGLAGAYSQILIDSRPIFSSLSGVYGLEQIPASMVERIEVVRGGGSALFGSSAIAGTINIITKEPIRNTGQISHTLMSIGGSSSFDNNTSLNASIVSNDHKTGLMIFGQKRHRSAYDHDNDGFSEIPQLGSRTIGFRSFFKTSAYSKITFEYHNMHEFRRGGDNLSKEPYEAYIAEMTESYVDGGNLKFDMFSPDTKHRFSIYMAGQLTKRKSYYGGGTPVSKILQSDTTESAKFEGVSARLNSYGKTRNFTYTAGGQYSYYLDKLLFMPSEITAGIEYSYDELKDGSGYRMNMPIDQEVNTKSVFLQNEWKNDMWSFLIGGRIDKHNLLKNAVFSPRANIRYNPQPDINLRVSYGKGFRAPQLFDEDLHVDVAGGENIISQLSQNLKEETSHSFSASIDWYRRAGKAELNFLAEGFFTILKNPFTSIQEEQEDGPTIKTVVNASGAKVYGLTLEARASVGNLFQGQLGLTIQKSRYDEGERWIEDDNVKAEKRMLRTPDVYGYFVATLNPVKNFSTTLSSTYTGNMLIPHEGENVTKKSPEFFELNWKIAYEIPFYKGTKLEVNAGIQNIFNSYQDDFDTGPDRASSYIYGPSLPRSYYAGAKLSF